MKLFRWDIAAIAGLGVLTLLFSVYKLTESPPVWYDEGWYIQTATNLLTEGIDGVQLAPGYIYHVPVLTVGYPLIYPLAGWLGVFGTSICSARSIMVLFIIGLVAVSYLLMRRVIKDRGALVASIALLATFPPLYGNGKSVLGDVPGIFYLVLFLLFFSIARTSSRKVLWYILAGLAAGLCISTKPLFILLSPAILIGLFLDKRSKALSWKGIGIFLLALIIPILTWFAVQFSGVTVQEVLTYYANPYHVDNMLGLVMGNVVRAFTDISPLYTNLIFIAWAISIFLRWKKKEQIATVEIMALSFSLLVIAAFMRIGNVYRYLLPAQVLSLLFFPAALVAILNWLNAKIFHSDKVESALKHAIGGVMVLLGLYQLMFSSWVADSYKNDKTAFWQSYFASASSTQSVFFYDTPEVVPFIQHRNYHQYISTPAGNPTGEEQIEILRKGEADMVIVATNVFEAEKTGAFDKYLIDRPAYKYTLLRRK